MESDKTNLGLKFNSRETTSDSDDNDTIPNSNNNENDDKNYENEVDPREGCGCTSQNRKACRKRLCSLNFHFSCFNPFYGNTKIKPRYI